MAEQVQETTQETAVAPEFNEEAFKEGVSTEDVEIQNNEKDGLQNEEEQQNVQTEAKQTEVTTETKEQQETKKTVTSTEEQKAQEEKEQKAIDDYWDTLSSIMKESGGSYEIPEIIKTGKKEDGTNITNKEKLALLANEILKHSNYSNDPIVDNFVKGIVAESKKEDFNFKEYVKQFTEVADIRSLPPDEKLFLAKKKEYGKKDENDQYGMTDEEIRAAIDKMSDFQKRDEIKKIDKEIEQNLTLRQQEAIEQRNKQVEATYNKIKEIDDVLFKNFIENSKSTNTFSGFEFSEADKEEFIKELPEFFGKKIVDGEGNIKYITSKAHDILNSLLGSPEKLMELVPLLWMYDKNKLKGYTSNIKEQTKKATEERLDLNPKTTETSRVNEDFNPERFKAG